MGHDILWMLEPSIIILISPLFPKSASPVCFSTNSSWEKGAAWRRQRWGSICPPVRWKQIKIPISPWRPLIGQEKHSYRQLLDFQVPTAQRFTTFTKPPVTSKCYTAEHVFTDQHKTLVERPKASSSEDKSDTGSHCPSRNAELDIDVGWYGSLWLRETSHFQSSTYAKGQKLEYNTIKAPMFSLSAFDVDVFNQGPCP